MKIYMVFFFFLVLGSFKYNTCDLAGEWIKLYCEGLRGGWW